jgi:hypothetical protein
VSQAAKEMRNTVNSPATFDINNCEWEEKIISNLMLLSCFYEDTRTNPQGGDQVEAQCADRRKYIFFES